jgi:orotate phosphoribosyltransferase
MEDPRIVVRDFLARHAYAYDPAGGFQLASGESSNEYIDCKSALTFPEAIAAAARLFHARLKEEVQAVGGLTMGADPIAVGVSLYSLGTAHPVRWFTVRKAAKDHGMRRLIEGGLPPASRVAIVEDVVTWGGSTLDAIDRCRQAGHKIVQVLALVDRERGGLDRIKDTVGAGVPVEAFFSKSELHEAWRALGGMGGGAAPPR